MPAYIVGLQLWGLGADLETRERRRVDQVAPDRVLCSECGHSSSLSRGGGLIDGFSLGARRIPSAGRSSREAALIEAPVGRARDGVSVWDRRTIDPGTALVLRIVPGGVGSPTAPAWIDRVSTTEIAEREKRHSQLPRLVWASAHLEAGETADAPQA